MRIIKTALVAAIVIVMNGASLLTKTGEQVQESSESIESVRQEVTLMKAICAIMK